MLPGVFQRTAASSVNPLGALLGVMEMLHEPSEEVLGHLDEFFDPRRAPAAFVPYLGSWVDLSWVLLSAPDDPSSQPVRPYAPGVGRLRELVAHAAFHARWRGTAQGMLHFLETATGLSGFSIDENVADPAGVPIPYHIRVHAPPEAAPYLDLVRRIVAHEKPAHVTLDPAIVIDERSPAT